jgi:opacity protein-like surface antigen
MRISAVLITVALLSVSAVATFSQSPMMMETAGIYVNAGGGLAIVPGTTETPHSKDFLENPRNSNDADWAFDLGFGVDGAVGYDFGIFRADLEFAYLTSKFVFDVDPDDGRGDNVEADDSLTVMAGMANAWYDLDTGTAWTPYIGIGVGATNLTVQLADGSDEDDEYFNGTGWGFAYQAGVGVAFEVLDGFSLVAGYQFFGTLETDVTAPGESTDDDDDHSVSPTLMAHGVQLGLRFLF